MAISMLIGIYTDPATPWLAALANHPDQRIDQRMDHVRLDELTAEAMTGCDCLLVDICDQQQNKLEILARLHPVIPIIVVVPHDHDFASGYPYGCSVQEIVASDEVGSSLFRQRLTQAVSSFNAPLCLDSVNSPVYSVLQSIVDYSSDWIILKDLDHRFLLASDAFVQHTGLSLDELVGKNDLDIGNTELEVYGNPEAGWAGFWPQDDAVTDSGEVSIELNPTWTLFSERPAV